MTRSSSASVTCGAGVAVVAGIGIVDVYTASRRVAAVGRADVAIVAVGRRPTHACSVGTGVVGCAGVAIAARRRIGRMHAASDLVARVVRTDIAVVAVGRRPAYA